MKMARMKKRNSPENAFVFNLAWNKQQAVAFSTLLGLFGKDKVYSIYQPVS